ncbi:MAG: tol-pal system protein YbgF [Gammaproteobacteria bacterium]|nr:tol-pal system protein YbgF [Gammaproteobacteria bacterium]
MSPRQRQRKKWSMTLRNQIKKFSWLLIIITSAAHAAFTPAPTTAFTTSATPVTTNTTTATTMSAIPPTVTNLTLAANVNQRLNRLEAAVHTLQRQNLDLKIKILSQQLSDLRTLVEVEGQELLSVNQQLQRLQSQTQRVTPTAPTHSHALLPIGDQPIAPAAPASNHHQVLPADSMASIKASAAYHAAMRFVSEKRYSQAIPALRQFAKDYPHSSDAPSAYYWLGRIQAIAGNGNQAYAALLTVVNDYPKSVRRPDALLQLATMELNIGNTTAAKKWLETVMADYPGSRSSTLAKQQLQRIP